MSLRLTLKTSIILSIDLIDSMALSHSYVLVGVKFFQHLKLTNDFIVEQKLIITVK